MLGQTPSELKGAARAIFAELIDNIFSPSRTELDGYAAPQVYFSRRRLPDRHRYFDDLATGTEWSLTGRHWAAVWAALDRNNRTS
jgi:hypothetical protein